MRLSIVAFATACLLTALVAHADTGIIGTWRGPENSVIRIAPCGGALCAQVLSTGDETAARIDTNNPNVALRTRPLCGLQIGEGFRAGADQNKADGGHLYDPRNGKIYRGSMVSQGDVLLLRGYVGVSMFGRTARWARVTAPVEMCRNTPPTLRTPQQVDSGAKPGNGSNTGPAGALSVPPPPAAPGPAQNAPATTPDVSKP